MKTLDPAFAAHIAGGVTTLAWCWKIMRRDGLVQGFTDHDRAVVFNGVTYQANSGFTASQMQSSLGLSVDNLDAAGALVSPDLTEADLSAGLYNKASVEIWRVDWTGAAGGVLMRKGTMGQVKRGKGAFLAEIRGLAQGLNQAQGRVFNYSCDADVGDARCKIDLTNPIYNGSGTVSALTDNRRFAATGLGAFTDSWFAIGELSWVTGANAGQKIEVKRHGLLSATASFELWWAPSEDIAVGDTFTVTVGCDRAFTTCVGKFANAVNFQGFLYMIGNDAIVAYANASVALDGTSRYGN